MSNRLELFSIQQVYLALVLVPALLLATPNFSVGVIIYIIIISLVFLYKNRKHLLLNNFDKLCLFILSIYFLINIPNFIIDAGNFRYFQGGGRLLLCIPVYLLVTMLLRRDMIAIAEKKLIIGVIIGSATTLIFALYQYLILNVARVGGFLYSINFGYLACSLAFLSFCLMKRKEHNSILFIAFLSSSVATVLTLTRGAIFAIPLVLAFIIVLRYKDFELKKITFGIIALSLSAFLSYKLSPEIQNRINYTVHEMTLIANGHVSESRSSGGRLELWKAATEAFKKSPLLGMTFPERERLNKELYNEHKTIRWVTLVKRGHAHNQYFEMLASNGLLGIIGFTFILFVPIYIFLSHFLRTNSLVGYTGGIFVLGFAIFGLTEVPLTANLIGAYYGFMLAIFLAIIRVEKYGNSNFAKVTKS